MSHTLTDEVVYIAPEDVHAVVALPTFVSSIQYGGRMLLVGEIGSIGNIRIIATGGRVDPIMRQRQQEISQLARDHKVSADALAGLQVQCEMIGHEWTFREDRHGVIRQTCCKFCRAESSHG